MRSRILALPALIYAKRVKAHTTEVKSSHVMYISHPADVAKVIEEAAKTTVLASQR